MSDPVDVQAERLRELADRFRNAAPGYVSAGERALGEALDEALALLAGQAEQIEQLRRQVTELGDAEFSMRGRALAAESKLRRAVRQRDNLQDAAQQTITGLDGARAWNAERNRIPEVARIDFAIGATLGLREALRAAAVGEEAT